MSDNYEPIQEIGGALATVAVLKSLLTAVVSGLGYYGYAKVLKDPKVRETFVSALASKFEKLKKEDPTFNQQWTKKYGELTKADEHVQPRSQEQSSGQDWQPFSSSPAGRKKSDKEAFKDWIRDDFPEFVEDVYNSARLRAKNLLRRENK